ncbi:hypothetical protein C0991_009685, partial [Blastosporella zonata]
FQAQNSENPPKPWEDWKLDKTFFRSLSLYTSRHPETRLDRVLNNICDGLEEHKTLFDLLPDNPFPARGMIGALAHLVKLGITVARAKATAAEFASQVVAWLIDVQSAFESSVGGGVDAVLGAIKILLLRQDSITKEIQKIQAKQREQFASILDAMEAHKQSESRRLFLLQTLSPHVVANPTYDHQGKHPCDEDTRTEILAEIFNWVDDISAKSQNFLWLTGDPGCGKSAITASLARHCKDRGILWAQFFINRNNVETTDPNSTSSCFVHLIHQTYRALTNEWEFEKFRIIVGAIVILREPLCLDDLGSLLNLRKTPSSSPVDIIHFARRLRTILVAGAEAIDKKTVPRLHKSFFEFIISEEVDQRFRISIDAADRDLAVQCLFQMVGARGLTEQVLKNPLSGAFRYALRFWSTHLHSARGATPGALIIDTPSLTWADFHKLLRHAPHDTHSVPFNVTFTRDRSQIIAQFEHRTRKWELSNGMEIDTTIILEGHQDSVLSVAYSPDGRQVVSGSLDCTMIIWDLAGCRNSLWSQQSSHEGWVMALAVSPDSKQIASGSRDKTVRIWDMPSKPSVDDLEEVARPFSVFSRDGTLVLSSTAYNTLRLWNSSTASSQLLFFRGRIVKAAHVTFSLDGSMVAAVSSEAAIYLWHTTTCSLVASSVADFISHVDSIAFTKEGQHLVTTYLNAPSCIWAVQDGKLLSINGQCPEPVPDTAFFEIEEPCLNLRSARWFSTKTVDSSVWAFAQNHIIRGREDGSITVLPVKAAAVH